MRERSNPHTSAGQQIIELADTMAKSELITGQTNDIVMANAAQ